MSKASSFESWTDNNGNGGITLGTRLAGEDTTNDVMKTEQRSSYVNLSASAAVKSGAGRLFGIFVASTTSGTIKIWDNTSAATTILVNTFTPAAATFYPFPGVEFGTGLYITLANTIDCTIFYK